MAPCPEHLSVGTAFHVPCAPWGHDADVLSWGLCLLPAPQCCFLFRKMVFHFPVMPRPRLAPLMSCRCLGCSRPRTLRHQYHACVSEMPARPTPCTHTSSQTPGVQPSPAPAPVVTTTCVSAMQAVHPAPRRGASREGAPSPACRVCFASCDIDVPPPVPVPIACALALKTSRKRPVPMLVLWLEIRWPDVRPSPPLPSLSSEDPRAPASSLPGL